MHLVLATAAQKAQRDAVTHAAWGSPLTVAQFQGRELRLRSHPWCRAGMKTWLWVGDDGAVLSSCESFSNHSHLRAPDGTREAGESFSIASVYTEPHLRGHGHATRMMDAVAQELGRLSPRAHAAVLFSDVGAPLYRRSGYVESAAWDWTAPSEGAPPGRAERLGEHDVASALARLRVPDAPLVLWPSAAQLDWHLERERIYAELLERPRPQACGAVVGDSTALWCMMARYGELVLLMLDARSPADAEALLTEARRVAQGARLPRVVVWEEPGTAEVLAAVAGRVGLTRAARDGALPMTRPLHARLPVVEPVPFSRALWV
ncbi:N-acetyltransferase [Corallococcus sp. H22C18031201]|uniref:GNAT family N-acetyltransferase n=1 Tax=Citreicoccus inhibens TaxID=2849499 RepID=UPI000E7329AF|nr:GNAT family N-acetyltransferase [Citreicoccus inhibens]MBU8895244.1 GNAT family N-acetyltransferase [Citreicoccus inhibens]RJS26144.1 N-acetyltransferase [Corallococcus sp. H22C18031201]